MLRPVGWIALIVIFAQPSAAHCGLFRTVPADAPTSACEYPGSRSIDGLRMLTGTEPVPFVFSCPGDPGGRCNSPIDPQERTLPGHNRLSTNIVAIDRTEGTWTCANQAGAPGWVPSARLSPLPETPAVPIADWLGWWRNGPGAPHVRTDRLLITRSTADPRILHVSGRAYWYGLNDNVHYGQINADAEARGPYLHVAEGDDLPGCILDLTYDVATHTFLALDNSECGGVNVRFLGTWTRFTPTLLPRR